MRRVILSILLTVATVLSAQTVYTYANVEEDGSPLKFYKHTCFNEETGEAYFDSLYISKVECAPYEFYHNTLHYHQTESQKHTATFTPDYLRYYTDLETQETAIAKGYIGREVRYLNDDPEWTAHGDYTYLKDHYTYGTGTPLPTVLDSVINDTTPEVLHFYEPNPEGWIITNKRQYPAGEYYYGYYKIKRTRRYTVTQTRSVYGYKKRTGNDPTYTYGEVKTTFSHQVSYNFVEKPNIPEAGEDNATSFLTAKESWTPATISSDAELKQYVETNKSWSPTESNMTNNGDWKYNVKRYYELNTTQTRSYTVTVTDYPIIWAGACSAPKRELDYLRYGLSNGDNITLEGVDGDDFSKAYIVKDGEHGQLSRTFEEPTIVADTIAQVRHHFMLCSEHAYEMGLISYGQMLDYYDITYYRYNNKTYSMAYTSTDSTAIYHEYDTDYNGTGMRHLFDNLVEEDFISNTVDGDVSKEANVFGVVKVNGVPVGYKFQRKFNFFTNRLGSRANQKLFFSGNWDGVNTGTTERRDGWAHLENCEVYLDEAYIRAENSHDVETFTANYNIDNVQAQEFTATASSAAVFVVKGNSTTTFHAHGINKILSGLGGETRLRVHMTTESEAGYHTFFWTYDCLDDDYITSTDPKSPYIYRRSAPIEILDDNASTVVMDATWPNGKITKGFLSLESADNAAAPLYTGGPNGTFVINGGYITLAPADFVSPTGTSNFEFYDCKYHTIDVAHAVKYEYHYPYNIPSLAANKLVVGGRFELDATIYRSRFHDIKAVTGSHPTTQLPSNDYPLFVHGVGMQQAEGKLIINGGTIYTPKTSDILYAPNIEINGGNIEINGGSIETPIYSVNEQRLENGKAELTTMPIRNNKGQEVRAFEIELPKAMLDYSHYCYDSVYANPEDDETAAYCINKGTSNQYYYGMRNVRSNEQRLAHIHIPVDLTLTERQKNFVVRPNDVLTDLKTDVLQTQPVHFTVYDGGQVTIAADITPMGKPYYKRKFPDNHYVSLCLPFAAVYVWDEDDGRDFQLTGYVSSDNEDGVPAAEIDNSHAYFYLYHLSYNKAKGINDTFRQYYTTHGNGAYLRKNQPYVIKFSNAYGDDYWCNTYVVFEGEDEQIINGTDQFEDTPERPHTQPEYTEDENNLDFYMYGNATFAANRLTNEMHYTVDYETFKDDNFHTIISPIRSCEGYLVGSEAAMEAYHVLGKRTNYEDENDTIPVDLTIIPMDTIYSLPTGIEQPVVEPLEQDDADMVFYRTVSGGIEIYALREQPVWIYTLSGQLVKSCEVRQEAQVITLAPALYILRSRTIGEVVHVN